MSVGVATDTWDGIKPRTMIGYQDTEHLRRLTQEDKNRINDMQKEHGFDVTHFDFLPELSAEKLVEYARACDIVNRAG